MSSDITFRLTSATKFQNFVGTQILTPGSALLAYTALLYKMESASMSTAKTSQTMSAPTATLDTPRM